MSAIQNQDEATVVQDRHKGSVYSTHSAQGVRKKSVAEEPVTSVLAPGEVPVFDRQLDSDEEVLAALGYK